MKNLMQTNCPCWVQNDMSDEAAYEIHIFLSSLAGDFSNHYHNQIDQHEKAVSFLKENNSSTLEARMEEDELPF